jgi:hypothetical protein
MTTKKSPRIIFLDGDRKAYGLRSSKVLPMRCGLPFDEDNCGPYGPEHARHLASLKAPPAKKTARWVIGECPARNGNWEWHVGKLVKVKRGRGPDRPSCIVGFNNGQVDERFVAASVLYVNHAAPYILSGPYEKEDVDRFTGVSPKSPLRLRSKASVTGPKERYPQPIPLRVGQKIIGAAPRFFDGYYTGVILKMDQEWGLTIILFDNNKTYGYPNAVTWFRPIYNGFKGKSGPHDEDQAHKIWRKYGSLEQTLKPQPKSRQNHLPKR